MRIELENGLTDDPVAPRNCTLLLAIPLSQQAFLSDLRAGPEKGFAKTYAQRFPALNDEWLWRAYEPYAALATHVACEVMALGVRVVTPASLTDSIAALRERRVTTMIGHWRSARFRPEDLSESEPVREYLAGRGVVVASDTTSLVAGLNSLLDAAAAPELDLAGPSGMAQRTAEQRAWFDERAKIEGSIPGLRGGAAVEFGEGFRRLEEIVQAFPEHYRETLDLTVCQSVVLAELLKRKSPSCRVLMSADLTSLDFRLALYHQTVALIARKPAGWPETSLRIRKELVRQYEIT